MPIINRVEDVKEIINTAQVKGIAIPCFCTENPYTTEAILMAASEVAGELNIRNLPVFIAFTGSYPGRQNLKCYTCSNNIMEGFMAAMDDIKRLARKGGLYDNILVMPHFDHGQPGSDDEIFKQGVGFFASVMYDCSHFSLGENMKQVKEFKKLHNNDYIVEGAVDEIYSDGESKGMKNELTEPETALRYIEETGVDLVVVNLGTEHRSMSEIHYHSDWARKISAKTGKRLVLHGTSSLKEEELEGLKDDGIVKINIWTILETLPAQALSEATLRNLGHILPGDRIKKLVKESIISPDYPEKLKDSKPGLDFLTEVYRRNCVKVPVMIELIKKFFKAFGYRKLGNI